MYLFKCKKCGEYAVDEVHFKQFLTPLLAKKLEHTSTTRKKIILEFQTACPRCDTQTSSAVTLKLVKIITTPAEK